MISDDYEDDGDFSHVMVAGAREIRNIGKPGCHCEVHAMGDLAQEPLFVTPVLDEGLESLWREVAPLAEYEKPLPEYKKNMVRQVKVLGDDFGSDCLGKIDLEGDYLNDEHIKGILPAEQKAGTGIKAYLWFKIKPPNQSYPPPALSQFDVEVERSSQEESWGLYFHVQDDRQIYISGIMEGPFTRYNDVQDNYDLKVAATDFITAVNGKTTQLVDELKTSQKATLTIRRGVDLTMFVEKGQARFASDLLNVSGAGLVIKSLGKDGMFKAYNDQTNDPNMSFQVNDRIVSINGKTGKSSELQRMIKHAQGKFNITVIRCPPDDNGQSGRQTSGAFGTDSNRGVQKNNVSSSTASRWSLLV